MAKTRVQKEDIVIKITDKLSRSKTVVFADFQGLNMSQLSDLRNKLAETGAELSVTKNSLLERALANCKLSIGNSKLLQGPIATLFAYEDEIAPIKILTKALKDYQNGSVKAGFLNQDFLDEIQINRLAQLPSQEELRARVVELLSAPLYGMVGVLQANLRNLVYALSAIQIRQLADERR